MPKVHVEPMINSLQGALDSMTSFRAQQKLAFEALDGGVAHTDATQQTKSGAVEAAIAAAAAADATKAQAPAKTAPATPPAKAPAQAPAQEPKKTATAPVPAPAKAPVTPAKKLVEADSGWMTDLIEEMQEGLKVLNAYRVAQNQE